MARAVKDFLLGFTEGVIIGTFVATVAVAFII
jgi:hypothetical protein